LITLCMEAALGRIPELKIFGTDYPTHDGTAVRDYIHVVDLASAHIDAVRSLGQKGCRAYNLGNGKGYSVKEVVELAAEVTGVNFPVVLDGRREGDPIELIASSQKASEELGWKPSHAELRKILEDAWHWHSKYNDGYGSK
jgi:UDP-glucose 4-epimerase